jgi:hypothetical protein
MKYIKLFESKYLPKIGEYVLLKHMDYGFEELNDFLTHNIAQIVEFEDGWNVEPDKRCIIEFEEISEDIMNLAYPIMGKMIGEDFVSNAMDVDVDDIRAHSSNIEDLEYILNAEKYNL